MMAQDRLYDKKIFQKKKNYISFPISCMKIIKMYLIISYEKK